MFKFGEIFKILTLRRQITSPKGDKTNYYLTKNIKSILDWISDWRFVYDSWPINYTFQTQITKILLDEYGELKLQS